MANLRYAFFNLRPRLVGHSNNSLTVTHSMSVASGATPRVSYRMVSFTMLVVYNVAKEICDGVEFWFLVLGSDSSRR